jgi:uncharacterized membrane protein YfcA
MSGRWIRTPARLGRDWVSRPGRFTPRRVFTANQGRSPAGSWGTLSGFTGFITHAGSPPVMVYLLPQKLDKDTFIATSLVFFFALNYAKILPYLWLRFFDTRVFVTAALLVPAGIAGIYAGMWMQRRIDVRWFYRLIYALLLFTGTKLLYDGITGLRSVG